MRWIYLAVIILVAAATIIFVLQKLEIVTMSFLGFNTHLPLALLVGVVIPPGGGDGRQRVRAVASIMPRVETYIMGSS
jgi:putative membrane protein